jgi:hypothetical protein
MTNQEAIRQILNSSDFTESDKAVVKWQFNIQGDFLNALWNAIMLADEDNLERLGRGFPVQVQGFKDWNKGNLAQRLRQAGLMI